MTTLKSPIGRTNGHDRLGTEDPTCPLCGSDISKSARARIDREESARAAKVEADLKARVAREIDKAVKAATQVAEAKLKLVRDGQDAVVAARVAAEREKAAKQVTQAINAERLQHSGEKLRLETALADLTRRLQRRTAGDLGDEGEVNLYEMLKAEFPGDDISRVAKGVQGPDIIHRTPCGSAIIFDSKNHKVWSNKWTTKLRDDMKMVSPPADHAVLVTTVFPKGDHHGLLFRDGVMVVSPSRVIPVAHLMRKQAMQLHALALSSEQRDEKTVQLYVLLTSNRTADLWERHLESLRGLLDIECADEKHQNRTRSQRIELINGLRSVIHDDFLAQTDRIMNGLTEEGSG